MLAIALFIVPFITGIISGLVRSTKVADIFQVIGSIATLVIALCIGNHVFNGEVISIYASLIYIDALGAFNIILISLVG